jgi:hypothetical protein
MAASVAEIMDGSYWIYMAAPSYADYTSCDDACLNGIFVKMTNLTTARNLRTLISG